MTIEFKVLEYLADGRFHSGTNLARELMVSRTSIWKYINALIELGVDIYSVPGKGYRLARPMQLLDKTAVLDAMDDHGRTLISAIDVHHSVDSTNSVLRQLAQDGAQQGHALLAEYQSNGRGRRGRAWVSPYAGSVCLSLFWRYNHCPANLGGLSLAVAVAAACVLESMGVNDVQVKWPNDLLWKEKKLAGILLELNGEAGGHCNVIVGIGINVNLNADHGMKIDQPWVDLHEAMQGDVNRSHLAAKLIQDILAVMRDYPQTGLQQVAGEWGRLDAMHGREVVLSTPKESITGIAMGIDVDGALLLQRGSNLHRFHCGEVSLRAI